jgi:hypothetical protein
MGTTHEHQYSFWSYLAQLFLEWEMFHTFPVLFLMFLGMGTNLYSKWCTLYSQNTLDLKYI